MIIKTDAYARIGFIGNPSDGYYGRTISCVIQNFRSTVTLWESPTLQILPNKVLDPMEFSSLRDLHETTKRDGYYGGLRLLYATCKKVSDYCEKHDITLDSKNFTLSYSTDVPRQVGLGGSSAIITALVRALMKFYGLSYTNIPKPVLPNLILNVETQELNIVAGLQDRVVQTYGGTVYMDFSKDIMLEFGHGKYEYIDSVLMPNLFLAYHDHPSDSGKIHSDVRVRYDSGASEVVEAMYTFGEYAKQAKEALMVRDYDTIASLMNKNFDLRRKIFSDRVIGPKNIEMIELARSYSLPAKLCGSGGAVVGMYFSTKQFQQLAAAYRERGFNFARVDIAPRVDNF